MHRLYVIGMVLVASLGVFAPLSRGGTPQEGETFCSLDGDIAAKDSPSMWSAASVQHHIRELLQAPYLKDSAAGAYALSYLVMTHARDEERCGGVLSADDLESEWIGDLLADVMSRWFILTTEACASAWYPPESVGICGGVRRSITGDFDSLRSALEMTGVYLSSHMAQALAAVILSDGMWNQHFPVKTHCPSGSSCPQKVIEERLQFVKRYKTLYDKNNAFLASRISTVIGSLKDSCYIKGSLLPLGSRLMDQVSATAVVFGLVRDKTFQTGMTLARTLDRKEHPMLRETSEGRWEVEYADFKAFSETPRILRELETDALKLFANESFTWITKSFGGLRTSELRRITPSENPKCEYPRI